MAATESAAAVHYYRNCTWQLYLIIAKDTKGEGNPLGNGKKAVQGRALHENLRCHLSSNSAYSIATDSVPQGVGKRAQGMRHSLLVWHFPSTSLSW